MDDGSPVDPDPQAKEEETSDTTTDPQISKTDQAVGGTEQVITKKSKKSKRKKKGKKKATEAVTMETDSGETGQKATQEIIPESSHQESAEVHQAIEGQSLEETGTSTSEADQEAATEEEKVQGETKDDVHMAEVSVSVTEEEKTSVSAPTADITKESVSILQVSAEVTEAAAQKEMGQKDEPSADRTLQRVPTIEITDVETAESEDDTMHTGTPEAHSVFDTTEGTTSDQPDKEVSTPIKPGPIEGVLQGSKEALTQPSGTHPDGQQKVGHQARDDQQAHEQQLANISSIPGLQDISLTSTDSSLEGIFRQEIGSSFQVIADDSFEKSQGIFPISDLSNYYDIPATLHSLKVDVDVEHKQEDVDEASAMATISKATADVIEQTEAETSVLDTTELTSPRSLVGDVIEQGQAMDYKEPENVQSEEPGSEDTEEIIGDVIEHNFSHSSADSIIRNTSEQNTEPRSSGPSPSTGVCNPDEKDIITQSVTGEQSFTFTDDGDKESMTTDDMLAPDLGAVQEDVSPPLYSSKRKMDIGEQKNVDAKFYSYEPLTRSYTMQIKDDQSTVSDIFDLYGEEHPSEMESFSDYTSDWRKDTDISKPEKKLKLSKPGELSYHKTGDMVDIKQTSEKINAGQLPKEIPNKDLLYGTYGSLAPKVEEVLTYNIYPKYKEKNEADSDLQYRLYKKYEANKNNKELTQSQDYGDHDPLYVSDSWQREQQSDISEDAMATDKEILAYSYRTQRQLELVEKETSSQRDTGYDASLDASTFVAVDHKGHEVERKKSGKARELDNILQDAMDNAFHEVTSKLHEPRVEDSVDVYADLMPQEQLDELIPTKAPKSTLLSKVS